MTTPIPVDYVPLDHCELAYRRTGTGEALLLLHGYPVNGLTWRHVIPSLSEHFTCYVVDLPGAGETRWSERTDFGFMAQAETIRDFVTALGLDSYSILAHDTGGTIARQLALIDGSRVQRLALIGTEIPHHRPAWIPLFQKISNPRQTGLFRTLLSKKWFLNSSAGLGGCFYDHALIHGEFYREIIAPVIASKHKASGLIHYLRGIDFDLVDRLGTEHANITAPTLLIWGEHDTVFPVERAREIIPQLGNCKGFVVVPDARLFVQEEKPHTVARLVEEFMIHGREFSVQ